LRSAAGKAGPHHAAPNDDVGRAAAGGQRKGQQTQASASSHALSLPELGDAADRLERRDGVGRPTPGGASLGLGGRDGERVADVEQDLEQELLAFICHAGWVPISAKILKGKRATSVRAIKDDMENAGVTWEDAPVVVDGNL